MATYDTSDIRKGLKVMMDGSPWTIVEFQFVKPGKGAAFTRTKFKNLLTGNVVERNIRSGEKLESADVEVKEMQYLYKDGESYVFMDTTTYDQVSIPGETMGDDALFMPVGDTGKVDTGSGQYLERVGRAGAQPTRAPRPSASPAVSPRWPRGR